MPIICRYVSLPFSAALTLVAGHAGEKVQKFFGNFPYPYMNGLLHLGHAFSLSKVSVLHQLRGRIAKHGFLSLWLSGQALLRGL